jgi:SSS family solute:Na+ symporter
MHTLDYLLVVVYLAGLLWIGLSRRLRNESSQSDLIVGGRLLTLPAFVASLVSTWYGGILGIGEFTFRFGISNWLVFGLPYYVAAALFALLLAKKARQSELLTIPDRLAQCYDRKTSVAGAVIVFIMTVPAAYILTLGVLCQYLFGWPFWLGMVVGTLFSVIYVYSGGFNSIVRTDELQFVLMFAGFILMFIILYSSNGGLDFLQDTTPPTHFSWHGGNTPWYIATWYFIALATLIEPAFYQRCYAAKSPRVAQRGIIISILCWACFDFLTTSCGLYARALLPDLAEPISAFPALAAKVLPMGMLGLFAAALLATVMSTVDSYSFLAASTFGFDIIGRGKQANDRAMFRYTRIGLIVSVTLAILLALFFRSVVEIWYTFGSIGTPALLMPLLSSFIGKRRLSSPHAFLSIVLCGGLSLVWYGSQYMTSSGFFWLGIQPIFPGLILSLALYLMFARPIARGADLPKTT